MKITFDPNANKSDVDFLTDQINDETKEHGKASPFGFFIKDDSQNIIAGANGFIIFGSVYTDQLWVSKEFRRKGIARKIMDNVHDYGRSQKCSIATIQTMEFQGAVEFYEKLGYIQDFKRSGYINNGHCIFMIKNL